MVTPPSSSVTYLERKIIIAKEVSVLKEGYTRLDNKGTVMYAGMICEERVGEENLGLQMSPQS